MIKEEKLKLNRYREFFREIIKQMQQKNIVADSNGDLSILQYNKKSSFFYNEQNIQQVLSLFKKYQISPLIVGQRVLAIHPKTKELRTSQLLTTDGSKFHC